ncbi:transporter substrate-binding domain-containing protein [Streptomyces sp. NPDC060028]|uniref:transporter substrate-binding domain-containing protein n=1 Tax=Streptomyces sp. NPDC060028 TaxID=3347041 RepID=UPI0036A97FD5
MLLALTAVSGCGSSWPEGDVRIGVKVDQPGTGYAEQGYPPYSGFDIRVSERAAEALGKKADFKSVESAVRQVSLDGEHPVDLVVATYSINNERLTGSNGEPAHDFAGPYAITFQGFMVKKGGPAVMSLSDLDGATVCVWAGTTSEATIKREAPHMVPVQKRTATDCIDELKAGRVRAVSTDQLILYGFSQVHKDLEVVPDVTLSDAQYYGIGLPKGHREACGKLREALKEYVRSADWTRDFKDQLPSVATAEPGKWETGHKPTETQIDKFSCRDKVGS